MLKPLSSSVPVLLNNVCFLHQNTPSRSGTCFTQLFPLWVALDETPCRHVWFPPVLLGGTGRFSVRQYQESESQIHESCCHFFFFFFLQEAVLTQAQLEEKLREEPPESVCRTLQQSQGSIGGSKRHPLFSCVYRWFFSPPSPRISAGDWLVRFCRGGGAESAGQQGRTRCAQQTRCHCVSGTGWDVEDRTWGARHRNRLKTWVVSQDFSVKGALFLLTFPYVFWEIIDRLLWTRKGQWSGSCRTPLLNKLDN